jgi:hypothetical protein
MKIYSNANSAPGGDKACMGIVSPMPFINSEQRLILGDYVQQNGIKGVIKVGLKNELIMKLKSGWMKSILRVIIAKLGLRSLNH